MVKRFLLLILLYVTHDAHGQNIQGMKFYRKVELFKAISKIEYGLTYIAVRLGERYYVEGQQTNNYNIFMKKKKATVYSRNFVNDILKDFTMNVLNNDTVANTDVYFYSLDDTIRDENWHLSSVRDIVNEQNKNKNRIDVIPRNNVMEVLGVLADKVFDSIGTALDYEVTASYTTVKRQYVWIKGHIITPPFQGDKAQRIYQRVITALLSGREGPLKWSLKKIRNSNNNPLGVLTFNAALIFYQ